MKNRIYLICFVMLLFSCSKEQDLEPEADNSGTIVLKMKPSDPSSDTRATEPGDDALNENKISTMQVFIFAQNVADNQQPVASESFGGLTFQGTGVLSKDLATPKSAFTPNATYDVYTLVNLPADVVLPNPMTLGGIKSLRTLTPISSTGSQSNFVMDGKTSVVLNPTTLTPVVYINMPLKRAVSKIRVKFVLAPGSAVAGATSAQISLKHFAKNSSLIDNNPLTLASSDYDNSYYLGATPATTFTFYCYENNWGSTSAGETYLMANLPYGSTTSNYYRIPINKYANSSETGRTERNMIYDVVAYIDTNGSDSENAAVAISSNCIITDWTTRSVVLKTITQHYLGISEYDIVMANVSTFTLGYVADLPVSVTNVTATCTQYTTSGVASTVTYTSGQSQFPTFTVNAATGTITITSAIPINYVPKYITFTVTNNQGQSLNATLVQYPARYVTARVSTGNVTPKWNQGGTNLNLFTVNTLVPSSDGSYTLGDPTNGGVKTDSTAIGNKMVSPRFIIASQYAVYTLITYSAAQNRCSLYGEDIYRSGWRMPTKAELELINNMQDDPNCAIKALLTASAYWSAFKYEYYNFTGNAWVIGDNTSITNIRCVYDIYKYEL